MKFAIQSWRIVTELAVLTAYAGGCALCLFFCLPLTADGPQCARLPIPLTATLPSCLWSLRIFPSPSSILAYAVFSRCKFRLEKLGLVDQNLLERNLSALLLGTLAVGKRQQSIGVAIDMELLLLLIHTFSLLSLHLKKPR